MTTRIVETHQHATLIDRAIAALGHATGLKATVTEREALLLPGRRVDATLQFNLHEETIDFVVEAKTHLDRTLALVNAKQQLAAYGDRGVLIAPYITAELARVCRERLNLQFIDTAGNAYLNRRGLFVWVKGERPTEQAAPATKAGTATRLRTVFALLCRDTLLNAPYREIAKATGVALGTIGWVFFDLAARGFITPGDAAARRCFIDRRRLIDEWAATYPQKLRPKLNAQRFHAPEAFWRHPAAEEAEHVFWGGEVAGEKLTNYLQPTTCTLYIDPAHRRAELARLATRHRLRADPNGEIEVLDKFWNFDADQPIRHVVPPLLAYADLVATLDPRNIEVAALIRDRYLVAPRDPA